VTRSRLSLKLPFRILSFPQKTDLKMDAMQLVHTQIPSDINTVEKLYVWALLLLDNQASGVDIKEDDGILPVPSVQAQIVRVADDSKRFIGRASIKLHEEYATNNTVKLWQHALELVNTSIPSNFTTN